MSDVTLVLLAAGESSRFELDIKKQWLRCDHEPLWLFVANRLQKTDLFERIIITSSTDDLAYMDGFADFTFIQGGMSRGESLLCALKAVETEYVLVSDIARACISQQLLLNILAHKGKSDCVVPYLPLHDTIVYEQTTIDREKVKRVQTPQLSHTQTLIKALEANTDFTDESSAIVAHGGERIFILGEEDAHKITYLQDLHKISCLKAPSKDILSGVGMDVHAFDDKGDMYLGGVKIESNFGFKAHSDGDVALHALIDALLGAAGMGDIGMLFPDNDAQYKGIDSKKLLAKVVANLTRFGFVIVNVDLTIAAQTPKLAPYKDEIKKTIAKILQIENYMVNIKATTTEKLGFIGRSEGVGVIANANLKYFDWTKI